MPRVPENAPPNKLNREPEPSRIPSKLRLGGLSCRGRVPSLSCEMSDLGVVTSFEMRDDAILPIDDDEFCRPNSWLRLFVNFFVSL